MPTQAGPAGARGLGRPFLARALLHAAYASGLARMSVVAQMVANIALLATVVRLIVGIARWTLSEGAKVAPVPGGGSAA